MNISSTGYNAQTQLCNYYLYRNIKELDQVKSITVKLEGKANWEKRHYVHWGLIARVIDEWASYKCKTIASWMFLKRRLSQKYNNKKIY